MRLRDHPLHVVSFAILAFAVLTLSACGPAGTSDDTDTVACTEDAMQCPDGTYVGRTGPDCKFVCPEPVIEPTTGTTFKQYMSQEPEQCMVMRFTCDGDEMFSDGTGCGCVREHNNAAVTLCTADYNPVCGWSGENVQCLVYPCAQTYGNLCMASVDPNVAYTTPGECPAPGSSPDDGTSSGGASGSTLVSECTDPRPEACTMQYDPVCATRADGTWFTAGNACSACGDADVVTHTPGECKDDGYSEEDLNPAEGESTGGKLQAIDCPAERQQACTREYMPVCGQRDDGTSNTYGNDCTACADSNVLSYTEGACA